MTRKRPHRNSRSEPQNQRKPDPVRPGYDSLGPAGYYATHATDYANPHEPIVRRLVESWILRHKPTPQTRVLDLACGSGEVTAAFRGQGLANVTGVDPYTGPAYSARTGLEALPHDFVAISKGALDTFRFDFIFCSFALHLAEAGLLPQVCQRLAAISPVLVILTPHKRPEINPAWGWLMIEELMDTRVRLRHYLRSTP